MRTPGRCQPAPSMISAAGRLATAGHGAGSHVTYTKGITMVITTHIESYLMSNFILSSILRGTVPESRGTLPQCGSESVGRDRRAGARTISLRTQHRSHASQLS